MDGPTRGGGGMPSREESFGAPRRLFGASTLQQKQNDPVAGRTLMALTEGTKKSVVRGELSRRQEFFFFLPLLLPDQPAAGRQY